MRVGLFTDTFAPDPNGVATSVLLLQRELTRLGVEVWVLAPRVEGAVPQPGVVRIRSVRNPVVVGTDTRVALPSRRTLPVTFDVVHGHTPWVIGAWARRVARRHGAASVATFHTHLEKYAHYVPGGAWIESRAGLVARASRRFYDAADVMVAPSDEIAELLRAYAVPAPVRVVPTGIDASLLAHGPARVDAWPPGTRRLLTVGRLGEEKRMDLVISALARIRSRHDAHLVVVGEGHQEGELRAHAAALGVAAYVDFIGARPYAEIGAYYRAAEVFVFGSETETQGLVLAEAQMMGVPVVAVGAAGTRRAALDGQSGFLVAPGDDAALAAGTAQLLTDDALRARLSDGARVYSEAFSAARSARLMLGVYHEALAARAAAGFDPRILELAR